MGRPPKHDRPMTSTERSKAFRAGREERLIRYREALEAIQAAGDAKSRNIATTALAPSGVCRKAGK